MAVTITIHPETPQERNIKKAVEMIRAGGICHDAEFDRQSFYSEISF